MKKQLSVLLVVLLTAATGRSDALRFDRISSDASSYFHINVDQFLASRLASFMASQSGISKDQLTVREKANTGGLISSITGYLLQSDDLTKLVVLIHADAGVRGKLLTLSEHARDALVIKYGDQEVHYIPDGLIHPFPPQTEKELSQAEAKPGTSRSQFMLGLGAGRGDFMTWMNGPSYVAFVGPDLTVLTADLHTMSVALDVLNSKKPSLAIQDLRGIKVNPAPGSIIAGAGLTAEFKGDNLAGRDNLKGSATQPVKIPESATGGVGLDLFGSFKGKAQLANFDMGEDERSIFVTAAFSMVDSESAEQLKNLAIGFKALFSLSKATRQPLIDPLMVDAEGKKVVLHWSWPVAKLDELARLAKDPTDAATSSPATRPHMSR